MTSGERPPAERLLAAAEELFGERSYRKTTVADICARAGIATGSFYAHYRSKAEIFAAVVRGINTDLRTAMKHALEHSNGGQRARERECFRVYFEMLSKRPWIDRIVRESEFIAPGVFREYYEHLARGYARGVRSAQLAGDVDARFDPEVVAYAYTGIGNFVGMRWADWTAGGQVPADVLDDVLELLGRGLAPRPSGLPTPLWTAMWRLWGTPWWLLGKGELAAVDNSAARCRSRTLPAGSGRFLAAGGKSEGSAACHSSGRGPSRSSSAT